MNNDHFFKFQQCIAQSVEQEQWVGFNIKKWWQYVQPRLENKTPNFQNLYDSQMSRSELKQFCDKNSGNSDYECAISIMAWGGQNRKHGIILFNRFSEIKPIIHGMRTGQLSAYEAYDAFYSIWNKKEPLGMGAAYFTKLIFFCVPRHKGYIMDQWTSKSVNLLAGHQIVHLVSGHVSKKNTSQNYRDFCLFTEDLAQEYGICGEDVEITMFSKGGRQKWDWRKYVIQNS